MLHTDLTQFPPSLLQLHLPLRTLVFHSTSSRAFFRGCIAFVLFIAAHHASAEPRAAMLEKHRTLIKDHCVACHGAEKQNGKFRVDDLPFTLTNVETAEKWQKVLNQMNSGEMPPEDEQQPSKEAKADFLDDLANVMVAARRSLGDQKGVITMRRLNRREYKNTLR